MVEAIPEFLVKGRCCSVRFQAKLSYPCGYRLWEECEVSGCAAHFAEFHKPEVEQMRMQRHATLAEAVFQSAHFQAAQSVLANTDERNSLLVPDIIGQEARNLRPPRPGISQKEIDPEMMILEDQRTFRMAAPFAFAALLQKVLEYLFCVFLCENGALLVI